MRYIRIRSFPVSSGLPDTIVDYLSPGSIVKCRPINDRMSPWHTLFSIPVPGLTVDDRVTLSDLSICDPNDRDALVIALYDGEYDFVSPLELLSMQAE